VVDPKQSLTKLRDEHALAMTIGRDSTAEEFDALAEHWSITTVEELLALSMVDDDLLDRIPIGRTEFARLREWYRASPAGAAEIATWTTYRERDYATGLVFDPESLPADARPATVAPTRTTTSVSLLDRYLSPIRDQAGRGTCTAFAVVACVEYHEHRVVGVAGTDLSEQFAYWNMVEHAPHHDLLSMFMALRNGGTCTEATWPYVPTELAGNDGQGPPPPAATTEARLHRPGTVRQLPARAVDEIQDALVSQRPVAIGIPVYASWFESPVVRKYGNITVPLPGEAPEPVGHAVALVGFADDPDYAGGGYFVVRNSWGDTWATESVFGAGYGTIPYRYVERCNWDAWCVTP